MNKNKPVMFGDALDIAVEVTKRHIKKLGKKIILVRDLRGRIRVLLPGKQDACRDKYTNFSTELSNLLGVYGYPCDASILYEDDLFQGGEILSSPDLRQISEENNLYLLDRQITGQDWLREPIERRTNNPRVTFFSVKGGVGRSTALVMWAWLLAKEEEKDILIFDFDLESPGVSSTLLPKENLPDYGIVDWFVEDSVGQSEIIEEAIVASSPLADDSYSGGIYVVPIAGRKTGDYLPKLSRCYADFSDTGTFAWGERLQCLVERIEQSVQPDLVLLDSRAGIHDIAAVLATRMDAETFLFGVNSEQTWNSYSYLFQYWKQHPQIKDFRNHLKMVSGMIPEIGRKDYRRRFTENAWDLFRDNLYDEAGPVDTDVFSFNALDEDGPHYPLPVFWHRALQEFDPINSDMDLDEKLADEVLKEFSEGANKIVFPTG